ncbi:rho GTPase-activating protein 7 isoform X2 [Condylostylus longicornis]|uniref:rho GTPase-activating protein 7 isoform X2 n=1 Tax=Condylostylus longicornis TaxID=2530218 RepID=UPI00244DF410|nr:rho GTPase-activating protein 7 isoform X2 [Condylostylus longicornis]
MQRRVSLTIKEYKFFRSFSQKFENWPKRKAEAIWRKMREKKIAEIEAIEACKWLRAAGFPQYAQMYEDLQFPIDLNNVAKDHPILENDPLQSLYRRLCILNRCAALRLDNAYHHKPQQNQKDDSDDENFALSDQWTFQPQIRRWSRVGEVGLELSTKQASTDKVESSSKESSPERFDDDDDDEFDSRNYSAMPQNSSDSSKTDSDSMSRLKRTGSERLKDGAKAFLRRVESIKTRRKKRQNRDGFVMSGGSSTRNRGPQILELPSLDHNKLTISQSSDKTAGINITYSTPPSPSAVSPIHFYPRPTNVIGNELKVPTVDGSNMFLYTNRLSPKHIPITPRSCHSSRTSPLHFFSSHMPHLKEGVSDDSAAYMSDSQDSNADSDRLTEMKKITSRPRFLQKCKVDDIGAHSDSECHATACRKFIVKELKTSNEHTSNKTKKLTRGGSLNLGKESKKYRESFQNRSFRSRGSIKKSSKDLDDTRTKKSVVRWHSFQNREKPIFFKKCISPTTEETKSEGTQFAAMSCGQLEMVRKLALVTLTGYMERYCPSHRTGWNWELPKFIKKIKAPDYKDKKIFGVPLVLILQRTGKSLPIGISTALKWLRLNALDQVGIFRKSGVKSRIVKLKESIESVQSFEDCMEIFDSQQAFDVADVLKQYFRELPDSLLTAKMSETFVAIFQHLPPDIRIEAIQAAVLLLPDENRDVLHSLLAFLNDVAKKSQTNQMTASNLAVCLAPSLFNSNIATGNPMAVSPRRRKLGQPNMKELAETKASHECLTLMIEEYKKIFSASRDKIMKCNFGYMEESKPVPLEQLGEGMQYYNWRGYLYECTKATIKEGREKSRGWVAINSLDQNIEIAYKKVGDGHLLRLWRCLTEVEGPPTDVLNFILNERNNWDNNLLECHEVKKLDEKTQIYYYSLDGQTPTDFCVLRSWQINNLPKQACVIVETSIDHRDAPHSSDSIRGVVLASRYLIEPCGSGRSRVMHLSRVDLKGKRPEWYNKNYGHICSQYLANIRSTFKHVAEGPESKDKGNQLKN